MIFLVFLICFGVGGFILVNGYGIFNLCYLNFFMV